MLRTSRSLGLKILQAIATLLVVSAVTFALLAQAGDPVNLLITPQDTPESVQALRERFGDDRPLYSRYGSYLLELTSGNLGYSTRFGAPVVDVIAQRFPRSLFLAFWAVIIALTIGIPVGIYSAYYRGRLFDRMSGYVASFAQAAPPFWLGALLIVVFGVWLGWTPVTLPGRIGFLDPRNWILPAAALSAYLLAAVLRLTRSGMIDSLGKDYVLLARGKGTPERIVVWRHAARNGLLSVVTFIGQYVGTLVIAAVTVEKVFGWPGLGTFAVDSLIARDMASTQAFVLLTTLMVVTINLLVDVVYGWLDPRVQQGPKSAYS